MRAVFGLASPVQNYCCFKIWSVGVLYNIATGNCSVTNSVSIYVRVCFRILVSKSQLLYNRASIAILFVLFTFSYNFHIIELGFPAGSDGKESSYKTGDSGLIPGLGRSGEGNGNPLQYSCLENFNRGAWWSTKTPSWGCKESDTTEWLTHTCTISSHIHICTHIYLSPFIWSCKLRHIKIFENLFEQT